MAIVAKVITKYPYTANYSVKANTNIHILKLALEEGLNCDAMSVGEITLLMKAGFPVERIFFVPNNVAPYELAFALKNGVMTSLDSLSQLELFGVSSLGNVLTISLVHKKNIVSGDKAKEILHVRNKLQKNYSLNKLRLVKGNAIFQKMIYKSFVIFWNQIFCLVVSMQQKNMPVIFCK